MKIDSIKTLEMKIQIEKDEIKRHKDDLYFYAKGKLKAYEECLQFIKNFINAVSDITDESNNY